MKVLITGCKGQVGRELMALASEFSVDAIATDHSSLDISNAKAVNNYLDEQTPHAVINAAAYTAVDKAEEQSELAFAINRDGPAHLAAACAEQGIPLLHISTDYVFDGRQAAAYKETDVLSPLGVYGRSKLDGDLAVQQANPLHIILRTSWVFSAQGNNFVKTMLRLAQQREELAVVVDQRGCPTAAKEIARSLYTMLTTNKDSENSHWGTYHFSQPQPTSWHGFAQAIFAEARAQGAELKLRSVRPISTEEYPTAAQRPANSVLECSKIEKDFNISIKPWAASLQEVISELRYA